MKKIACLQGLALLFQLGCFSKGRLPQFSFKGLSFLLFQGQSLILDQCSLIFQFQNHQAREGA